MSDKECLEFFDRMKCFFTGGPYGHASLSSKQSFVAKGMLFETNSVFNLKFEYNAGELGHFLLVLHLLPNSLYGIGILLMYVYNCVYVSTHLSEEICLSESYC